MSLINKLHELITPHVLAAIKNQDGDTANKTNLLKTFYAMFAARLSNEDVYQRANALPGNELEHGHHLLNVAFSDVSTGEDQIATLSENLGNEYGVSAVTARTAVAAAAPLVLSRIKELAGAGSVPAYLRTELANEHNLLPAWAHAVLPAGLFAGTAAAANAVKPAPVVTEPVVTETVKTQPVTEPVQPVTQATHVSTTAAEKHYEKTEKSSFLKTLLPIIGLLIFAGLAWLLLRSCQDKPAPVAAPVATESQTADQAAAAVAPATLSLAVDETGQAIYSCRAQAGNEELAGNIHAAVAQVFGTENCAVQTLSAHATTMPAAEHLPAILNLMKGVPNSTVSISERAVHFNAENPEAVATLVEGAKGILPADFTVEAEPALDVNTAVTSSIESARAAITGLGDTVEGDEEVAALINALNLQIINFATDSTAIPAENQEILDLAAQKLASLPETTLRITGHTDNQGEHAYNQDLSESRAAAVRDYLVSKGVPAERLSVAGASFDRPVASNATEQGRFQNRRIEFTLQQEGETVTQVGNAEQSPADAATAQADAATTQEVPAQAAPAQQ